MVERVAEGMSVARQEAQVAKLLQLTQTQIDFHILLVKIPATAWVIEVGKSEGIEFAFDKFERTPNLRDAHQLIGFANNERIHDAVVEAIFQASFIEGQDVGDRLMLIDVVSAAGLDRSKAEGVLTSDEVTKASASLPSAWQGSYELCRPECKRNSLPGPRPANKHINYVRFRSANRFCFVIVAGIYKPAAPDHRFMLVVLELSEK